MRLFICAIVILIMIVTGCGNRQQASPPPTVPTPPPSAEPAPGPTQPPPESGTGSAPAPETSAPAPPTGQPPAATTEPKVDAVVAKGITETHEPTSVTTEFTEDDQGIYLVHSASLPKGAHFSATLVAVNAEGIEAGKEVERSCIPSGCGRNSGENPVKEGAKSVVILPAPRHGFSLGDYRLDLEVKCWNAQPCTDAKSSLPLKVVSSVPAAGAPAQAEQVEGFNIAGAALGGKVVSATSQGNDTSRAAANLIDGHPFIITDISDCQYSCGWFSAERATYTVEAHKALFPQDLVFSFYKEREASVHAVVVDTTPYQHWQTVEHLPRHVEVWASTTSPTDGFSKVASARMPRQHGVHVISFAPAQAKYVRFRILSNYGERSVWVGEVKIIEAPGASSILADSELNLASFALGGVVVRFTSVRGHHSISALVDGSTDLPSLPEQAEYPRNWISADDTLPQEFVFAFRGDQVALIDRIVLNTKPDPPVRGLAPDSEAADPKNWPQQISVSVSNETPLDGFEDVGQFTLKQQPGGQSFPINRRARFLKLRILKNFGGGRTALNDVKILEGSAPGYQSILQTSDAKVIAATTVPPVAEGELDVEKEANNTPAEANLLRLGRRTKGSIDPLGEQDYFKLTIPGSNRSVLTFAMEGRPYIRTSVSLTDQSGKTILNFDPKQATARQAEFSWLVGPGDYIARVTEPPASVVLIWDTSGSMGEESVKNLKMAVEAYLDKVQPTEKYNLIRFSGSSKEKDPPYVEVLLTEFTSDPTRLKSAASGKFFSKGGTPLYDAVAKGIDLLADAPGNRAIVVMTDGIDTTSLLGNGNDPERYTAFWRLLEAKRIRLYTIGLGADMPAYYPDLGTTGTRFLSHTAMAMTARSFFTSDPEQLKTIYEQIAAELRTPSTYYLRPSVSPGTGTLSVTASGERLEPIAAPSQIELILDVSGSMKRQIEGRQMMDIAKDVMVQVIKGLPDNATVALRFYGHRIREGRSGDCQDSELVFPLGRINKAAMINRVRAVKALGTTPIAYTLRQVQRDFGRAQGEKLVILVTDGKEECGGSPSAVVSELVAKGIKLRLNIVGFALAEAAVRQEMDRVAKLTGGKFYDAQNARSLRQAIQQSLAVAYDIQDAAGTRVSGGLTGEAPIKVPEGIYTVTVRTSGRPVVVRNVRVKYNGFTKIALRKEGQQIGVRVVGP